MKNVSMDMFTCNHIHVYVYTYVNQFSLYGNTHIAYVYMYT